MNEFFNRRKENKKSRNNNLFDRGSSSVDQTTDIRDREWRLIGTKHYDSTSRETQCRNRDGRLEYTSSRNGNEEQIRDRSGRLKWTEQK